MIGIAAQRYDVIVAGARCAGSATAMLLAQQGLRVLVVDPARRGSDTLSTHALMRSAVVQLHRWGLLDEIQRSGAPAIRRTTFHYGDEVVPVDIREKDGVDALYAPRRTVLDRVLGDAAREAGAVVAYGHSVTGLCHDRDGRVVGAEITDATQTTVSVGAELVIGADGVRSRVARLVGARKSYEAPHKACSIYGYLRDLPRDGNHWYYGNGVAAGAIPTNGATCVFTSIPSALFEGRRDKGLVQLYREALQVSPELANLVEDAGGPDKLRAFPGIRGFLRESIGPGWALVGDAGYFRDPLTAHGISDALREAELISRAILNGTEDALTDYQANRDQRVRGLLDVTDRIASLEWSLATVKEEHLALTREMKSLGDLVRSDEGHAAVYGRRPRQKGERLWKSETQRVAV
ncbi:MAG: NAD(P)/FAD-dependent oxidoreductase [Longimicrobiales bacterium]